MRQEHRSRPSTFRPTLEQLESRWVPANVGTPNQNFVDQLYRDVLHRAPDPASAGFVAALDRGVERGDVVDGILNSDEGLRNQVNDLYVRFLDRTADAGGLAFWTSFLRSGNSNLELATQLIGSQEYFVTQGGGTNLGYVNAVYQDVLCRPIGTGEFRDRSDDFDDGIRDRVEIAEAVLESDEGQAVRDRLSVRSFLRASITNNQAQNVVDNDDNGGGDFDNDDAVFAGTLLAGDTYFTRSQRFTVTDFATIPSCDNLPARPLN